MIKKEEIKELLKVGFDGIQYIQEALRNDYKSTAVVEILNGLKQIVVVIEKYISNNQMFLSNTITLFCKNMTYSIDKYLLKNDESNTIFICEIRPCYLEIMRLFKLGYEILLENDKLDKYRCELFNLLKDIHSSDFTKYKFKVSIIVIAYNKLEYTQKAVESIYKYTDFSKNNVELITFNNGSTDSTEEYFNSLPNIKKINLKYNVLGGEAFMHTIEGRYIVIFTNDVIATPNWLDNLLLCIESEDSIGIVVPTCNEEGTQNLQGVKVNYDNNLSEINKIEAFAMRHNHSNPALWEERPVLMPFLSIARYSVLKHFILDPFYTQCDFIDDDMSTLLRRTGWKQILAKDTFVHHFGGVTLKDERRKSSIENMRKVYFAKWGVDAWESRGQFIGFEDCLNWHTFKDEESILMLEPCFGDSFLKIKNQYRKNSKKISYTTAVVCDKKYIEDAYYMFDEVLDGVDLLHTVTNLKRKYDIISFGTYIHKLPVDDVITLLESLYVHLNEGGMILFPTMNYGSAYAIMNSFINTGMESYDAADKVKIFHGISVAKLITALKKHPFLCKHDVKCVIYEEDEAINDILCQFAQGLMNNKDEQAIESQLKVRMLLVGIMK